MDEMHVPDKKAPCPPCGREQYREFLQEAETMQKLDALREQAARTLLTYPVLTAKDRIKRMIRSHVLRQKQPPVDVHFWPNALLAGGLAGRMRSGSRKEDCVQLLKTYFDLWIKKDQPIYYVDNITNGLPLLDLYEETGEEKYLTAADRLADYLRAYPRDAQGNLAYRLRNENLIFADGIGMVCPFLCRYGMRGKNEELVRLGLGQIQIFLDKAMDGDSGLPYHGFDSRNNCKQGCIGWGRAVGWLMMGMADSLAYLRLPELSEQSEPTDSRGAEIAFLSVETKEQIAEIRKRFASLVQAALPYQRKDGSFAWLLPAKEGPADSSATAMIACALLVGMQSGILKQEQAGQGMSAEGKDSAEKDSEGKDGSKPSPCLEKQAETAVLRAARFLRSCIRNGKVEQCSAECEGFAQYPQRYGNYPWSDGPALRLFEMMEEMQ